jgi:hypothetical protein
MVHPLVPLTLVAKEGSRSMGGYAADGALSVAAGDAGYYASQGGKYEGWEEDGHEAPAHVQSRGVLAYQGGGKDEEHKEHEEYEPAEKDYGDPAQPEYTYGDKAEGDIRVR